jgi:hypothetical protein
MYWATKWGDLLRVKAEFPINLWPNAVQAYSTWIRTNIEKNAPYDQFVREMLTASGSNFRAPPANFYRALQSRTPEGIAQAVAITFMGTRADKWSQDRLSGMAGFFSYVGYKHTAEWKEEIVYFDYLKAAAETAQRTAVLPDGSPIKLSSNKDPREVFADWLVAPENPWFARNIVNRIWYWLRGRGIIHEPDDIHPDNPPSNPELLTYLEKELIQAKYDLKHIYRLVLKSNSYQLSSIPKSDRPDAGTYFAHYAPRQLDAEALADALCQITGTTEEYSSHIPEPYTFIPKERRSIELPGPSTSSPFLSMFGRPARDTGLEAERKNTPSVFQRLHLLNSSHIRKKLKQGSKLRPTIEAFKQNPEEAVTELYLLILSRFPTEKELQAIKEYTRSKKNKSYLVPEDLAWALINTAEFLYRH